MTRLWARGKPLRVRTKQGKPSAIQWDRTWHSIQHIALDWQVDLGWWKVRVYRDYYRVLLHQGSLVVIYHDLVADTWALQRVYD